jgi:hypothetical protein
MRSIYQINLKCDTMKSTLNKLVLSVGGVLMTASNALAAEFENTGGFLSDTAEKLDPLLQSFGQFLAENVPLAFKIIVGSAILGYAVSALIHKKKGNSAGSSEHKINAWDAFTTGLIAIILFSVFSGICKSFGV